MQARCSECGDEAQQEPPTTWLAAWGPKPEWSHEDGEPLCPVVGPDGYEASGQVTFI